MFVFFMLNWKRMEFFSPEILLGLQWDKVEDKYAVSSLAVAGVVALWGSTGMISVRSQNMHICLV